MFRFTIRDVLWLTVVMAMAAAMWSQRAAIQNERSELSAERESLNARWRDMDRQFLRLVDATDKVNQEQAALENQRKSGQ
jgi:uncharacterized coiled-coil DUF342 family protein